MRAQLLQRKVVDVPRLPRALNAPVVRALVLAGCLAVTLAACGIGGAPAPAPVGSGTPEAPDAQPSVPAGTSPGASPEASASASPEPPATPVTIACLDLVSLQTMYDFDPNFGLEAQAPPAAGTPAAIAVANAGVSCSWVQQSNGARIVISLAQPAASVLASLKADAGASGTSAETFSTAGGEGTVEVFDGAYWLTATSSYFASAEDARPLIDAATAAMG